MAEQQSENSSDKLEEGLRQILNPHDGSGRKPPGASTEYPRKKTEIAEKKVSRKRKLPQSAEVLIRIAAGLLALALIGLFALQIAR